MHPNEAIVEEISYTKDWQRAGEYWRAAANDNAEMTASLASLTNLNVVLDDPGVIGNRPAEPNILVGLSGEKTDAETFINSWYPGGPRYGTMPHFDDRAAILAGFSEEAAKLGFTQSADKQSNKMGAEGILLFELKFGIPLSEFAIQILDKYPPKDPSGDPSKDTKKGKIISLFGLSGSGKSTITEVLQEHYADDLIIMDSDTMKYNLLAKMVKDAEATAGIDVQGIKDKALMHNAISGALYVLIDRVSKELVERGYMVVKSSSRPEQHADVKIYVEHPDGIDPTNIADTDIPVVAKTLFERTQARVHGADDYDWDNAETVLDFRHMKPVTVQVPEGAHAAFLRGRKKELASDESIVRLSNPRIDDPEARKAAIGEKIFPLIDALAEAA